MAKSPGIPPHLHDEVRRRAGAGESNRSIASWLKREHKLNIAHTTVGRFLARYPGTKQPPKHRQQVKPEGPAPPPRKNNPRTRTHAVCGAKTRTGGSCHHYAGLRTDHPGRGRCWMHGGRSRALPGNQNALKTGEMQSIFFDVLDEREREFWDEIRTAPDTGLDEDIRLMKIRLRRMLATLAALKTRGELDGGLVLVETCEQGAVTDHPRDALGRFAPDDDEAPSAQEHVSLGRRRTHRSVVEQIRYQEEAITRVQGRLVQALRLRHRILQDLGEHGEQDPLAELAQLVDAPAQPDQEENA